MDLLTAPTHDVRGEMQKMSTRLEKARAFLLLLVQPSTAAAVAAFLFRGTASWVRSSGLQTGYRMR
jgi:hypothetical protein